MGLLGDIYSASDSLKRKVKGLLSDPAGYLSQVGGGLLDDAKITSERNKRMVHSPETMTREDVSQSLASAMNFAPIGMTAWHGSPYKFDKFDISKIGTGEGAQAYGHGLYLAESPEVAKSYQTALASDRGFSFGGKSGLTRAEVQDMVNSKYGNVYLDNVIRPSGVADSFIDDMVTGLNRPDGAYPRQYKPGSQRAKVYDELRGQITHADPGSLYKTDIPDEAVARFLDWDKPLSQQAPEVRAYAEKVLASEIQAAKSSANGWGDLSEPFSLMDEMTGSQFLQRLRDGKSTVDNILGGGGNDVSNALRHEGIPGIRYLDGGSRSAGQGSSNFVIFDPEMIRILERNGQATGLQPWQPGEYGLLGQ